MMMMKKMEAPKHELNKVIGNNNDLGENFLVQPVLRVLSFSSQYGGDIPPEPAQGFEPTVASYSVKNLEGEPCIYPAYGDAIQAAVFRSFGGFWTKNSRLNLDDEFEPSEADDYVDLYYLHPVFSPIRVEVYETFNVNCVYRISGGYADSPQSPVDSWSILWKLSVEDSQKGNEYSELGARIFRPQIKGIDRQINVLRLEMQTRGSDYYPEIDAVKLCGYTDPVVIEKEDVIMEKESDNSGHIKTGLTLEDLPPELLRYIVQECVSSDSKKLEIATKLSGVCRKIRLALSDCNLFSCLDLKPFALRSFNQKSWDFIRNRSSQLRKLRFSWMPAFNADFSNPSSSCLTTVHLQSCLFVDDDFLDRLCSNPNLEQLDLSNCRRVTPRGFQCLANLRKIRRLSLCRTLIDQYTLRLVLSSFRKLEAVCLGSLTLITNMDAICFTLAECCPVTLRAVDFWRAGTTLTSRGIKELATSCRQLEEIDIGWCRLIDGNTLAFLTEMQSKIRRLMLTANRCVRDEELAVFGRNLPDLEQLDILGSYVGKEAISGLLSSCQKMNYLDVSYCGLSTEEMDTLREMFPQVHIPTPST